MIDKDYKVRVGDCIKFDTSYTPANLEFVVFEIVSISDDRVNFKVIKSNDSRWPINSPSFDMIASLLSHKDYYLIENHVTIYKHRLELIDD